MPAGITHRTFVNAGAAAAVLMSRRGVTGRNLPGPRRSLKMHDKKKTEIDPA
jgi:hypothetical protein